MRIYKASNISCTQKKKNANSRLEVSKSKDKK